MVGSGLKRLKQAHDRVAGLAVSDSVYLWISCASTDGELLYDAISRQLRVRHAAHRSLDHWCVDEVYLRVEKYALRRDAERAESHAIWSGGPPFNRRRPPGEIPPEKATPTAATWWLVDESSAKQMSEPPAFAYG